jgi:hypothetical protein
VLRAKLRQRRAEAAQAERAVLRQGLGDNAWGNQIRWVVGFVLVFFLSAGASLMARGNRAVLVVFLFADA